MAVLFSEKWYYIFSSLIDLILLDGTELPKDQTGPPIPWEPTARKTKLGYASMTDLTSNLNEIWKLPSMDLKKSAQISMVLEEIQVQKSNRKQNFRQFITLDFITQVAAFLKHSAATPP